MWLPMKHAGLLCAGLILTSAALAAQQPGQPRRPPEMTGCPLMQAMLRGPAAALRARGALHLSEDQVTRLEAAQRQVEQARARMTDSMRALHPRIAALADAPRLDERAARAAFERMGRMHADVAVAMLRAQHEAAAVLTPQQRDSLAVLGRARMDTTETGRPGAARSRADADECAAMMMEMGSPGPRRSEAAADSARSHEHRADSSKGKP